MGMECPRGHGRQNVLVNITPDASNPRKASDIVAYKLGCGCVVGGEEYEMFKTAVDKIDRVRSDAIRKIDEQSRQQKGAAYSIFVTKRGGANHAE